MVEQFSLADFIPHIEKPQFGDWEHRAILNTPSKSVFFYSREGDLIYFGLTKEFLVFRDNQKIYDRVFINGGAMFKLANELGLSNVSVEVVFPRSRVSENGKVSGALNRYKGKDKDGLLFWETEIGWGVEQIYQRFGKKYGLVLSVNHVFHHELYHLHERSFGLPKYEEEEEKTDRVIGPAEDFALKKMAEIIAGRKDLQPLIIV